MIGSVLLHLCHFTAVRLFIGSEIAGNARPDRSTAQQSKVFDNFHHYSLPTWLETYLGGPPGRLFSKFMMTRMKENC